MQYVYESKDLILSFLSVPNLRDMIYLVKDRNISDESIQASSELSITYVAKQVRMNHYADSVYGWVPDLDDFKPWVQFDMEHVVTAWGVVVKLPGNNPHINDRITSLKVAKSGDGEKWRDVSDVIYIKYNTNDMLSISWFKKAATAQYWKINILTWQELVVMKADLIGQISS